MFCVNFLRYFFLFQAAVAITLVAALLQHAADAQQLGPPSVNATSTCATRGFASKDSSGHSLTCCNAVYTEIAAGAASNPSASSIRLSSACSACAAVNICPSDDKSWSAFAAKLGNCKPGGKSASAAGYSTNVVWCKSGLTGAGIALVVCVVVAGIACCAGGCAYCVWRRRLRASLVAGGGQSAIVMGAPVMAAAGPPAAYPAAYAMQPMQQAPPNYYGAPAAAPPPAYGFYSQVPTSGPGYAAAASGYAPPPPAIVPAAATAATTMQTKSV